MHVDVHLTRIAIQEQQCKRIAAGRHQVVIGGRKCVQQHLVADQTAVDKQEDRIAIQLLNMRAGDQALQHESSDVGLSGSLVGRRQADLKRASGKFYEIVHDLRAKDLKGTVAQTCRPDVTFNSSRPS